MPTDNKSPYFDRADLLILQMAFDILRARAEETDDKRLLETAKGLVIALKPDTPAHAINETALFLLNPPQSRIQ
jgi:hypothetical protein